MRRRIGLAAVVLAVLLCPRPCQADVSPRDYAARIAAALKAVQVAQRDTGVARARDLAAARRLLPPVVVVRLDGVRVQAVFDTVRADLRAGHLGTAVERLSALRAALDTPAAHLSAPNARQLAALDHILSGPPFVSSPDVWATLWRLVMQSPLGAVIDAIGRLLRALFGSASGPALIALPVVAGLIVAAALIFAASRLFGRFVPQAALPADGGNDEHVIRVDAAGARARAATLAASGAYREAARYIFLSTLLALDEAGRLRIDRATGNRDVLRQARDVPHLAEALAPVVRGFELFWFGHLPVTRDDYERYRQLNERALEVAR